MKTTIILMILMAIWIPVFLWTEYKWNKKNYLYTKTLSSIMFLAIGVSGCLAGIAPKDYSVFILAALIFGLIGDVMLVFSHNLKFFKLGLLSFLIGQLVYGTLFLRNSGFSPYDMIIYASLVAMSLIVNAKSQLKFGKMKIPALFYMLTISFMYTMALSTIYKGSYSNITTTFIVVGTTLFAASDMVLAFDYFKPNSKPVLKRINLFLYYFGQLALASSIISFAL